MITEVIRRTTLLFSLAVVATGCATNPKNQIASLEKDRNDLAAQLQRTKAELDAAKRARDELDRRFQAANRTADDLRAQLANQPVPAEPAAPGWTAVPGGAMIAIDDSVLFAPGKNVLRDQALRTLDAIASTIEGEYAGKDILVFGHTDDRPIKKSGWEDNWQLSAERALAVVRYLGDHGVAPDRLAASGCGEHRPRAKNDSEANRSSNRRVEIFAIDPQPRTGRR